MIILSKEHIERLNLANVDQKAAAKEFLNICRLLIRPGVVLYWHSRGYHQNGIVQGFVTNYSDMWVENSRTGKVVKVSFESIDWDRMISQADIYAKEFAALEKVD